jgi:hypothetical protein
MEMQQVVLDMQYIFKPSKAEKQAACAAIGRNNPSPPPAVLNELDLGAILAAAVPQTAELSSAMLENVIAKFEHTTSQQHESILVEGEVGEDLYVLLSGSVQVAINGKVIRVISKPGATLGEKALIHDNHVVGATATLMDGDASFMRLHKSDYILALKEPRSQQPTAASDNDVKLMTAAAELDSDAASAAPTAVNNGEESATYTTEAAERRTESDTFNAGHGHGNPITDWHWHSSKWEARASRTTLNDAGGYESSEDHPGYGTQPGPDLRSPTEELADPYIDNFVAAHQLPHSEWPGSGTALENVLMVVTRTRNHNAVVYRANMTSATEWDMDDPIDVRTVLFSSPIHIC